MKQVLGAILVLATVPALAVDLQLTRVSDRGLVTDIRHAGDGSGRLFLIEQNGQVWILDEAASELGAPFLDLQDQVVFRGERGLLSLAFAPDHGASGHFYVWYTDRDSDMVLSRFSVSSDANLADPDSEEILLAVPQPAANHNGGRLLFGPDGYLYVSTGDGGGAGDPYGNGQNLDSLLGAILRLDVDPRHVTYAVPGSNPLVGSPGADELWAWGLRNPWRMSFDRLTGELYIADVGQNRLEEINLQPALGGEGRNYGWPIMEGTECFAEPDCDPGGLVLPVAEYGHDVGCSISGGEVYRGNAYPELNGAYLYGDYCNREIRALRRIDGAWRSELLATAEQGIITFGEGEDGSVYIATRGGGVFRLSDGPVRDEPPFAISAALNDAWGNAETPGQGFFVVVLPVVRKIFLAWFTFDAAPPEPGAPASLGDAGQRWLTALGDYSGNTATLEVELTRGGVFDALLPGAEQSAAGTLTLKWTGCDHGALIAELDGAVDPVQIPIRRVVKDNVAACEAGGLR